MLYSHYLTMFLIIHRWYRDSQVISPVPGKTMISPEGSLTITDVEVSDEAEYMCKASNIGGTAMMHTRLDVRGMCLLMWSCLPFLFEIALFFVNIKNLLSLYLQGL